MSPTIFRHKGYRFFFFSREETRMHVHVSCEEGEVKFRLEPNVTLAENHGLTKKQLNEVEKITREYRDEIITHWKTHFSR